MNFNDQRAFGNDDNIVKEVYIKSLDKYCMLRVHVYVKPVDEATTIVSLFFPFAILVSLVMALLISTYYSRVVSKPLIKINEAAKKMAKLDFDNYIEVDVCLERGANLSLIYSDSHKNDDGFDVHQIRCSYYSVLNCYSFCFLYCKITWFSATDNRCTFTYTTFVKCKIRKCVT